MADHGNAPRLLIPALGGFYRHVEGLSYLLIRLTVGLMLVPHGWPKVFGVARFADGLARRGWEPALPLAYLVISVETLGGLLIAIGFLTRPLAAAVAIEMAVITFIIHWSDGRYEFPLMWGLIAFAVSLRGGGPYSVDRKLGWEI